MYPSFRHRLIAIAVVLGGTSVVADAASNFCLAGKEKCISKKAQGLLKCQAKADKLGVAVNPTCVARVRSKFDGSLRVPPNPAKGCFEKLEARQDPQAPASLCPTEDDTAWLASYIDGAVDGVVTLLDPTHPAIEPPRACVAGKKKCVAKYVDALFKCYAAAERVGFPPDPACITAARGKFDGNDLPVPEPAKGCFEKLEDRQNFADPETVCDTEGDTETMQVQLEAFVLDAACLVGNTTICDPTPSPTPTPAPSPGLCGNGMVDPGEDCEPPGSACAGLGAGFACSAGCECPCPGAIELTGGTAGALDLGWTGFGHDVTGVSDATMTADVTSCAGPSRPCGTCLFAGPVPNAGAADYGAGTGSAINNRRCSANTRLTCAANADCAGAGTCEYFYGTRQPISIGGLSLCLTNQIAAPVGGAYHAESGTVSLGLDLRTTIQVGPTEQACPRCRGDATPNDGIRGGTCDSGVDDGMPCDVNGTVPNPHFGETSLDCALDGDALGVLPYGFFSSTGAHVRTLSATSPQCRRPGSTTSRCFCDSCNSGTTPIACASNAGCPDPAGPQGPFCGGPRCASGANGGKACASTSECPGGSCLVPGDRTAPNQCDDLVCTPTTGFDGECANGPAALFCEPNATHIECTLHGQADCDAYDLRSCVGGPNEAAVCTSASECPGGSCDVDQCTGLTMRSCFTDNGVLGAVVQASGAPDVPLADEADPLLASLFCVAPNSSLTLNGLFGLPGLGRITVDFHVAARP